MTWDEDFVNAVWGYAYFSHGLIFSMRRPSGWRYIISPNPTPHRSECEAWRAAAEFTLRSVFANTLDWKALALFHQ